MLFKIINAAVLDAYHVPVTILGPGDKQMKKKSCFYGAYMALVIDIQLISEE